MLVRLILSTLNCLNVLVSMHHIDYESVFIDLNQTGGDVVVTTIEDNIAFEDDTIVLRHETDTGIKEGLEQFGEFLRDFTIVKIIDNEGKYFNFYHIIWFDSSSHRTSFII